jgi:sphinganine-1-phosphate aldolase
LQPHESAGKQVHKALEQMSQRGWSLNGLRRPPAIHIAVTLRHTEPGVAQRFVEDLRNALNYVKQNPTDNNRNRSHLDHASK